MNGLWNTKFVKCIKQISYDVISCSMVRRADTV